MVAMRWLLTASLPLVVCLGCPGQRRPPPRAEPTDPQATSAPERASPQAQPRGDVEGAPPGRGPIVPPSASTDAPTLEGLRGRLQKIERGLEQLRGAPERARWERLIESMDALQDRAYALQDQLPAEEQDLLYDLLERLAILRDEAVRLEPAS